jgi:hypothetical protein
LKDEALDRTLWRRLWTCRKKDYRMYEHYHRREHRICGIFKDKREK